MCPKVPPGTGGVLIPSRNGILGSKATFSCPRGFKLTSADRKTDSEETTVQCTPMGWRLADGSFKYPPYCRSVNIAKSNKCAQVSEQFHGRLVEEQSPWASGGNSSFRCNDGFGLKNWVQRNSLDNLAINVTCTEIGWLMVDKLSQVFAPLQPCDETAVCKVNSSPTVAVSYLPNQFLLLKTDDDCDADYGCVDGACKMTNGGYRAGDDPNLAGHCVTSKDCGDDQFCNVDLRKCEDTGCVHDPRLNNGMKFDRTSNKLACPSDKIIVNAGNPSTLPNSRREARLRCVRHNGRHYWQTEEGGYLHTPDCVDPGECDCAPGEICYSGKCTPACNTYSLSGAFEVIDFNNGLLPADDSESILITCPDVLVVDQATTSPTFFGSKLDLVCKNVEGYAELVVKHAPNMTISPTTLKCVPRCRSDADCSAVEKCQKGCVLQDRKPCNSSTDCPGEICAKNPRYQDKRCLPRCPNELPSTQITLREDQDSAKAKCQYHHKFEGTVRVTALNVICNRSTSKSTWVEKNSGGQKLPWCVFDPSPCPTEHLSAFKNGKGENLPGNSLFGEIKKQEAKLRCNNDGFFLSVEEKPFRIHQVIFILYAAEEDLNRLIIN